MKKIFPLIAAFGLISVIVVNTFGQENQLVPEKIQHVTDRNYYIAGEKIWFEAFVKPSKRNAILSKILYLEVFDDQKKVIHQQKFNLVNDAATGYLELPANVLSGNYVIRSYTLYQRNFSPLNFSHSMVTIINPNAPLPASEIQEKGFTISANPIDFSKENAVYAAYIGEYFLERNPVRAWITSPDSSFEKVNVELQSNGLASFSLHNKFTGKCNFNLIVMDGDTLMQPFKVEPHDVVLKTRTKNGLFELGYHSNQTKGASFILKAYDETGLKIHKNITLSNEDGTVDIVSPEKLTDGFVAFTLETPNGKKIADDLVYKTPEVNNQATLNLPTSGSPRETISIDHSGVGSATGNIRMVRSNTIYDEAAAIEHLFFNPSLTKNYIFDANIEDGNLKLLLPLIKSQVVANLELNSVVTNKNIFIPESEGLTLHAVVKNKNTGSPESDIPVYLSVLGKGGYFIPKESTSSGVLSYTLYNLEEEQSIFLTIPPPFKDSVEVLIENDFEPSLIPFGVPPLSLNTSDKAFIEDLMLSSELTKMAGQEIISITKQPEFPEKFYGNPETHVRLKDYIDLPSLEEVFHEIVMNAAVKKQKDETYFVLYENHNLYSYENPLVLLDNVPVFNYGELLKIPPAKINYIDVVNSIYIVGNTVFRGIVSIYTNKSDFGGYTFPDEVVYVKYLTASPTASIDFTHTTNGKEKIKPDFRNMVFWDNKLQEDKKIIQLPDDYGDYRVLLRGIDAKGKIINKQKTIKIKKESHQDLTHFPLHTSSSW